MTNINIKIGLDRFLALRWADYSLELFLSCENEAENYRLLKEYLKNEITGEASARKTSNQLKRLWLNNQDEFQFLRDEAATILKQNNVADLWVFHFGMAINVFPIFRETCRKIGELSRGQPALRRNLIVDRVSQVFLSPNSIPRVVSRVIQTLEDWKLVETYQDNVRLCEIPIEDINIGAWFVQALMFSQQKEEVSITSVNNIPDKLGLKFPDIRQIVQQSNYFSIRRNASGDEVIVNNDSTSHTQR